MQRGTPCRVLSSNQGVVSGQICSDLAMSAPPAKEGQLGSQDDGRTDGPNRPGRECRELAWFFFFFLLSGARSRKEKGRVGGKWKCEKPGNPTTVEQNPLSSLVCGKLIAVSSVSSERAPSVRQTRPQRFACFFFLCTVRSTYSTFCVGTASGACQGRRPLGLVHVRPVWTFGGAEAFGPFFQVLVAVENLILFDPLRLSPPGPARLHHLFSSDC